MSRKRLGQQRRRGVTEGMVGALGTAESAAEARGLAEFAGEARSPARVAVEAWLAGEPLPSAPAVQSPVSAPAPAPTPAPAPASAPAPAPAAQPPKGGQEDGAPRRRKGRRAFVPVDVAGGDERFDLLPGRRACECQATRHRLVGNCLACGRVVCQQEGPGPCLFCGALVGGSDAGKGSPVEVATGAAAGAASTEGTSEEELRAIAFKETLLTYDREASKRTTVIDDQSDFFEIESNAWLSHEEKGALMQRQRVLEEAEERRRKDFRVTIDLVSREVRAGAAGEEGSGSGEGSGLAFVTREAPAEKAVAGATTGVDHDAPARPSVSEAVGRVAAPATPGAAGPAPLDAGMMPNPLLVGQAPSYVSKAKAAQRKGRRRKEGSAKEAAEDRRAAHPPPPRLERRRVQEDELIF